MSEEHPPVPPEAETIDGEPVRVEAPHVEAPDPPSRPPRRRQRTLVPWVYALAFVVLGWAVMFLWWHPTGTQSQSVEAGRVAALDQQIQGLGAEVKQLAARPAGQPQEVAALQAQLANLAAHLPAAPDLSGLERRIDALEQRKPPEPAPPPDLAPIQQKLAALEQQVAALTQKSEAPAPAPAPDQAGQAGLAALSQQMQDRLNALDQQTQQRLSALDQQTQQRVSAQGQQTQDRLATVDQQIKALSGRIDAFAGLRDDIGRLDQKLDQLGRDQQAAADKVQSLATAQNNAEAGLSKRIDDNAAAVQSLQGDVHKLDAGLGRAIAAARAEAALAALQAGRPVGTVPDAPPAVARYSTEAPPTLAQLRRSFEPAAEAALAASRPSDQGGGFLDRAWTRAQGLVTVRQGDRVIVGDPAAGVIARARDDLDAGDLAGTVGAVSSLTGPAAQAMADWLQSARSLLAARTALIGMAGQG